MADIPLPPDLGRIRHLTAQMHRSEDDSGVDIPAGLLLAADGAGGHTWTDPTSGGTNLGWFNVKDYGALGDGSTDDTVAIQATITAAGASGTQSGTIWFPAGTYIIGGALQDTGAFNGQLLLPNVSTASSQITLRFLGAARPPFAIHGAFGAPGGYSILKSTLTGASGTAAVVSGGNGALGSANNVSVVVEDLLCTTPDNPTFTWWNLSLTQGGSIRNVMITPHNWSGFPQPTNTNSYGIKLPQVRDSNYTYVDGLVVYFFYTGIRQGELATVRGLILSHCAVGVEFPATEHASLIVSMQATSCPSVLKTTGIHFCDILSYDSETGTGSAWADIVYDLDDTSNYLNGNARYTGFPLHRAFVKNGGTNYSAAEIGPLAGTSGTAGGDLSGTYPNPTVAKINGSPLGTISAPVTADRLRWNGSAWVNSALIWISMTAYDPTTGNWLPLVDGSGNQIIAEV